MTEQQTEIKRVSEEGELAYKVVNRSGSEYVIERQFRQGRLFG